jgi:predicted nucleotidyltransferase
LNMNKIGNQHHYQANPGCPIYVELIAIIKKTVGLTEPIRKALSPVSEKIDWAFVFGSIASGKESAASDIDLMIIGELGFSEAANALYPVQEALGREVNPKIFRKDEWIRLEKDQDAFIRDVMTKPRMDVMGGKDELG